MIINDEIENPFKKAWILNEIKNFNSFVKTQKYKKLRIENVTVSGVLYDYFGKALYENKIKLTSFYNNNILYMSNSPMEIQSHYVPYKKAHGNVLVAGLGLGYYVWKLLNKSMVKKITVVETCKDTIDLFKYHFRKNSLSKVDFVNTDINNYATLTKYDFFYYDIKKDFNTHDNFKEEIHDMHRILISNPMIKDYSFWGMELVLLYGFMNKKIDAKVLSENTATFFKQYFQSDFFRTCNINDYNLDVSLELLANLLDKRGECSL